MVCLLDVVSVASDENHRCAASNDDTVIFWSFTVNDFPFIRDITITSTLLVYLKGQRNRRAEIKSRAQSTRPKARPGEATPELVNLAFSRIDLRQRSSKMFGVEDEAFVDIQFKALVECSKKYICGHNRNGDASPALDVQHMPTNVDKAGAMIIIITGDKRRSTSLGSSRTWENISSLRKGEVLRSTFVNVPVAY